MSDIVKKAVDVTEEENLEYNNLNRDRTHGRIVHRKRFKPLAYDVILAEEVIKPEGMISDTTVVGTGFESEQGEITLSIKPGMALFGKVKLVTKKLSS